MPATACTATPLNASSGAADPPRSATARSASRRIVNCPGPALAPLTTTASACASRARTLAQRPGRQRPAVAESPVAVDDDDFTVPAQCIMLQAVVADNHVAAGFDQEPRRLGPRAADRDRQPRAAREQQRLVADRRGVVRRRHQPCAGGGAAIAAARDSRPASGFGEARREPGDQRRLAGAADAQVADDDDRARHLSRLAQTVPVEPAAGRRSRRVDRRKGISHGGGGDRRYQTRLNHDCTDMVCVRPAAQALNCIPCSAA